MSTPDNSSSREQSGLSPLDEEAVRAIIAEIDRFTARDGRRRIDIAHACLSIAGTEIAANATDAAGAKRAALLAAGQLKTYVRDAFARRDRPPRP